MGSSVPRAVVVSRATEYQELLARHATAGQARFFLETRGQRIELIEDQHHQFESALGRVLGGIPRSWRRARVLRDDLDRFLFEPGDIVVVLGQDGLVANTAKYLAGQTVIGLNPDRSRYDGILVSHQPEATPDLLAAVASGRCDIERRTMVEAVIDGRRLVALNELFVGHQSHQSARYRLSCRGRTEEHTSSGLIVSTGTGATGWALSINRSRREPLALPHPDQPVLAFFVREAFPSVASGVELTEGLLEANAGLSITSRMNQGGVIFGDGIEDDRVEFSWGRKVEVGIAANQLSLLRA